MILNLFCFVLFFSTSLMKIMHPSPECFYKCIKYVNSQSTTDTVGALSRSTWNPFIISVCLPPRFCAFCFLTQTSGFPKRTAAATGDSCPQTESWECLTVYTFLVPLADDNLVSEFKTPFLMPLVGCKAPLCLRCSLRALRRIGSRLRRLLKSDLCLLSLPCPVTHCLVSLSREHVLQKLLTHESSSQGLLSGKSDLRYKRNWKCKLVKIFF